jgi:serine/threonine protein kinase
MKQLCYPVKEKLLVNDEECLEKWELLKRIGEESTYAEVWIVCCNGNCDYVLKYLPYENDNTKEGIIEELNVQNKCSELDLCPKIADAWLCDEGGAIVMEIFQVTIANLLLQYKSDVVRNIILANVIAMLDKLHYHGFYHGDAHLNNFMVKEEKIEKGNYTEEEKYNLKNYKYYFIDFGKSGKLKDMGDPNIEKDYKEVYDHLLDLVDENSEDIGLKNLSDVMLTHIKKFD